MHTTTSPRSHVFWGAALIVVVTVVVYGPALRGQFLLDDNKLLTDNAIVQSPDGLYQFWFTTHAADYWPLTNTSFWLEWRLWGLNSTGYHITNLLLHIAAVLLIWSILRKLAIPGAFLAALLFALHPVNVESVAWISQRKNTLALVLFLISILSYLLVLQPRATHDKQSTSKWYWLSLFAFLLAMFSKGSVVILPLVLLLITWWQRRRIDFYDLMRTSPFFLVAIALGILNVWFQTHSFAESIRSVTFAERLAGAGAVVWFYLAKAFLPINLLFVYPQWRVNTEVFLWWLPLFAAVGATLLLWQKRDTNWGRPLFFAWAFFVVALAPILGFADVGFLQFSLVADHYQHIALIAVVALLAASIVRWRSRSSEPARSAIVALPCAIGLLLAALVWQRASLFGDPINLYIATLQSNPQNWQLRVSLSAALNHAGRHEDAVEQCREALRLNPNNADSHFNLAVALGKTGRIAEALQQFQQAQELRPDRAAEVESAIGSILIAADRFDEAIDHCQQALRLKPNYAQAHKNLGMALLAKGQINAAIEHDRQALAIQPDNAEALSNLAAALLAAGRPLQAMQLYQHSLQLQPDSPEAHYMLANLLIGAGNKEEAIRHYQQAVSLKPDYADAEGNWGSALVQSGRAAEAIPHFLHVLQLQPNSSDAHSNLGIALHSIGKSEESIEQFQQSLKLKNENFAAHFNLGLALKKNRLPEAVEHFEQALAMAPNNLSIYAELLSDYEQLNQSNKAIAIVEKGLDLARSTGQTASAQQMEDWLDNLRHKHADSSQAPPKSATDRTAP